MSRRKYPKHIATVTAMHFHDLSGMWVRDTPLLCYSELEIETTIDTLTNYSEAFRPDCKFKVDVTHNDG